MLEAHRAGIEQASVEQDDGWTGAGTLGVELAAADGNPERLDRQPGHLPDRGKHMVRDCRRGM
jgi:hypothetical protein